MLRSAPPRAGGTRSCLLASSGRFTTGCAAGSVFSADVVESRPGLLIVRVAGKGALSWFAGESGGHRWQRVPPTEKRGRVQTSTVTVAVLPVPKASDVRLNDRDLDWKTCRGSGAGGQHRNVTDSAVQLTHKPTGIQVRVESERSQRANRDAARAMLAARLQDAAEQARASARSSERRRQVGSGMRGDKVRTYREQDDTVRDHRTGKTAKLRNVRRGELALLR